MFDLFKKQHATEAVDVKSLREGLLRFVKTTLSKWEGEAASLRKLQLFIACPEDQKPLYESAVYMAEEMGFRQAVQKVADDFALQLPANWELNVVFADRLPAEALKAAELPAALFLQTRDNALPKRAVAQIRVLQGEAEQPVYAFSSDNGRINIGREKKVQTHDAFYRVNTIAFPAESNNESNRFISRQHAHIEWSQAVGAFLLFADEGGVPPKNKIKVRAAAGGEPVKLQSTKTGHLLANGDQIVLGETALLEFSYSSE